MAKAQFESAKKPRDADAGKLRMAIEDKGIVQQVDKIIQEAVEGGATEIHLEPLQDALVIRTRIKGTLRAVDIDIPVDMKNNVINRIKVLSGMDITRTKIPQSGFFKLSLDERKIELYTYVMPTLHGEATIIKVQYKQSATLGLEQLGMTKNMLASFRKALSRGSGLYLITGPPGSGKRTTAYAAILEVLKPEMLAIGFDPVIKYEVPGMIQGKPEEKSEFTFAEGIQSVMKQEPDVAYIGDIICHEDARAAIQGAFAKRVVLCRMTANDCINAVQNIIDMGVQPFLLAASLSVIINQRILRRLCKNCREPYPAGQDIQKELGLRLPEGARFFHPKGCDACENTGFSGLAAIYELYIPSEELNKLIVSKASLDSLRQRAVKEGMISLKMDGITKTMRGLVTVEDVLNSI
jgi:type II secretory ATPase GspE/PulE/Tfp pilus assembly ATPase PilB-like protein